MCLKPKPHTVLRQEFSFMAHDKLGELQTLPRKSVSRVSHHFNGSSWTDTHMETNDTSNWFQPPAVALTMADPTRLTLMGLPLPERSIFALSITYRQVSRMPSSNYLGKKMRNYLMSNLQIRPSFSAKKIKWDHSLMFRNVYFLYGNHSWSLVWNI